MAGGGDTMRRGGSGLIAAMLALAGCKSITGPKTPDKDAPGAAARPRDKTPPWLHDIVPADELFCGSDPDGPALQLDKDLFSLF